MYLLVLTLSLCVLYIILLFLFPLFFENRVGTVRSNALASVCIITFLSFFGYFVSFSIQDQDFSNRFLHAFGGGFLGFLTCFLAARDSKSVINKFQFFILSVLIVTALGVANEIAEFLLQNYTEMVFATTINDTWLDLASNTIGILTASIFFTSLWNRK